MDTIDFNKIPPYTTTFSLKNKVGRLLWNIIYFFFFRPALLPQLNFWRIFLLKLFGAKIGEKSIVYPTAKIWAPWNLAIGKRVCIGPNTEIYNPLLVRIGNKVTISQKSYICGGSHDTSKIILPFIAKQINIHDYVWICADSFVAMGITIGEGAIVGARSSVFKNVEPWSIVGGNPAKFIKERIIEK